VTEAEALALAIEAEKQSLNNYLGFAWSVKDASGKQMFIRLAMDEYAHMRLLESPRAGRADPALPGPSLLEQLVPRLSDKALRIRGLAGQGELPALLTALELERAAGDFYRDRAKHAESEPARALFVRLTEMEAAHEALIQAELDSIRAGGFWFGLPEFSLEKER
jgi:rubrerythrin